MVARKTSITRAEAAAAAASAGHLGLSDFAAIQNAHAYSITRRTELWSCRAIKSVTLREHTTTHTPRDTGVTEGSLCVKGEPRDRSRLKATALIVQRSTHIANTHTHTHTRREPPGTALDTHTEHRAARKTNPASSCLLNSFHSNLWSPNCFESFKSECTKNRQAN